MSEVIKNSNTSHEGTSIDKTYNRSSVSRQCIPSSSIYAEKTVIEDTSNEETTNKRYNSSVSRQCIPSSSIYAEKTVIDADMNKENVFDEFKKLILFKLNKILYKMDILQNKMNLFEEKISHPININEELDIQLPILSLEELQLFEEQLEEERFRNQMLHILKLVGGSNPYIMIRNMLKKVFTNTLALQFSWAGKKAKRTFKDLKLANIIIQAVRTIYTQANDTEIITSISKWLAQANLRCQRERPTELR